MKILGKIKILSSVLSVCILASTVFFSAEGGFMSLRVSSPTAANRPDMKYQVEILIDGEPQEFIPIGIGTRGDADGDDNVSVRDAAFIARYLAFSSMNPDFMPDFAQSLGRAMADANNDGKLNVRDAAMIARYLSMKFSDPDIYWDNMQ